MCRRSPARRAARRGPSRDRRRRRADAQNAMPGRSRARRLDRDATRVPRAPTTNGSNRRDPRVAVRPVIADSSAPGAKTRDSGALRARLLGPSAHASTRPQRQEARTSAQDLVRLVRACATPRGSSRGVRLPPAASRASRSVPGSTTAPRGRINAGSGHGSRAAPRSRRRTRPRDPESRKFCRSLNRFLVRLGYPRRGVRS